MWIKTAVKGKELTSLDHNIRVGNSIISDHAVDAKAFDWQAAFPEVFEEGGFDVVIGNPPYIRQEWLSPVKPYLQSRYASYHGMADLYVYFYELGLNLLKPGGRLSYVVTNKWMRAGYGEPLRKFFAENGWVESVVDFGHAKQIFKDADVFPSIVVVRRPYDGQAPSNTRVCCIPREQLQIDDLSVQIDREGAEILRERLDSGVWSLEPRAVFDLLERLQQSGCPLSGYSGVKPRAGFSTGFNEAFVIDAKTRSRLISEDAQSGEIIKPYLRGQDIDRWVSNWAGLWLIFPRRGIDIDAYPAVRAHLEHFRDRREPKPPDWRGEGRPGRKPGPYKWFEIQDAVDYWELFGAPKIIYPDLTWRSCFSLDLEGSFGSKTLYFLPTSDTWLLAVLNAPISWWFAWRKTLHGKDEVLRYHNPFMESVPVPAPSNDQRAAADTCVRRLIDTTAQVRRTTSDILDWLRSEHSVTEPTNNLLTPIGLDCDSFVSEVRKVRGRKTPLSLAALRSLRDEHAKTILPAQAVAKEALSLERRISDLVNQAYGLTPEDVELMWATAPPRMPISKT